jgi:hypothetical protein
VRHPGSVQGHRNYLAEMPSVTTSGSGALQMLPLTVSGQPLEISLERLGQPMSLYVPLSKGTLYLNAYATGSQARAGIGNWIAGYNSIRPHQGLGYRTPNEVYFAASSGSGLAQTPMTVAA